MIDTQTRTYNKPKSDACHCADPKPGGACCNLVCFERPNYFCGHLLTDTDLSTEQRYAIEKRKLQNRTLHGWGVVCGLRLTCDEQCGGIMVDEGYAIDDCGNDLVVCQPLRFDVLAELREKGYLVGDAAYDPCKPKDKQDDCKIRQCFYITICYEEEAREFTTPFVAGCRPSLTECEPTRIREGVRFDVLNELPKKNDWLEELECRIKHCYGLFTDGQFADTLHLRREDLYEAVNERAFPNRKWWELFCTLRGLLLLYLSKHPDKYNCTIDYEIRKIPFPEDPSYKTKTPLRSYGEGEGEDERSSNASRRDYAGDVSAAFCKLLELANQYIVSCILGEMIFPCKEPCEPACVVLGTIEVVGDKVVHVCNCPRSYVWSFASFWEVMIANVVGGLACEKTPADRATYVPGRMTDAQKTDQQPTGTTTTAEGWPGRTDTDDRYDEALKRTCCSVAKFDCKSFVEKLRGNQRTIYDESTATLKMFAELRESLRQSFDFTRPETHSPSTFLGMKPSQARKIAHELKLDLVIQDEPFAQQSLDPLPVIRSNTLSGTKRTFYAYRRGGEIVDVRAEWREEGLLDPADRAEIYERINEAEQKATQAMEAVENLRGLVKGYGQFKKQVSESIAEAEKPASKKRTTRRRGLGTPEGGEENA